MKAGKYTIKELFLNNNVEQIIIPEIQRDYVWGKEQIKNLLDSIQNDYIDFQNCSPDISSDDNTVDQMFKEFYKKQKYSSNIGFIYAYNDVEYKNKYFLIDGQQRLTTIYLLIFALYNKINTDKFNKYYFNNKILKLDYKVRESAHDFLFNFISNITKNTDLVDIKNEFWYLSLYDSDSTIQSILKNYITIVSYLNDNSLDSDFLDYIENYTEFWFFDTSISKQGEELYLSMNSRGEAMQSNENIKALLLKKRDETLKNKYGKKWEEWQHLFWKNRGEKINADDGFNEFIKWILIIEEFKNTNKNMSLKEKEKKFKSIISSNNLTPYIESLEIELIEEYYEATKKLNDYELMNKEWLNGGVHDKSNNISQIYYMNILPLLLAMKENNSMVKKEYGRYKNFFLNTSRFVDISKNPDTYVIRSIELVSNFDIINKNILDFRFIEDNKYANILSEAEKYKMEILDNNHKLRESIEQVFRKAEQLNILNGDITVLLNCIDVENFSLDEFSIYYEKFKDLFAVKNITNETRQALLSIDDYKMREGWTYNKQRYSFQITNNEFNSEKSNTLKNSIVVLLQKIIKQNMSLIDIKNEFNDINSWRYNFINNDKIFNYAKHSKITWDEQNEKPFLILNKNDGNAKSKKFEEF